MFGIYKYANGLQFTGMVAKTEEEAWAYIKKTTGVGKIAYEGYVGAQPNSTYVVKELKMVGAEEEA